MLSLIWRDVTPKEYKQNNYLLHMSVLDIIADVYEDHSVTITKSIIYHAIFVVAFGFLGIPAFYFFKFKLRRFKKKFPEHFL